MASSSSKKVVIAAFIGNFLIAITKFAAAAYTGSSAMFSEGVHSLVDTGNQALLLYGMRRAPRPADDRHPFGYGMEIFFWAFVVAILLFAVGAGVSIYEGVHKVLDPRPIRAPHVNYIVLLLAMAFEGVAWWIAFKEFNRTRRKRPWLQAIQESKDPSLVTVLLEDSAAMLGLFSAFVAILLSQLLDMPVLDGVASLVIGGILALAAALLAYETKALLIGEAADPAVLATAERIVLEERRIERINELRTMQLGPQDALLALSVDFRDDLSAGEVEDTISALEIRIKQACPVVTRIFIEVQSWQAHRRAPVASSMK